RKYMPITASTFVVGWLAIAGVIPFAGFWSKDEILAKAWFAGGYGKGLWAVGLVAALLTAVYMTRQVRLVFYGEERWRSGQAGAGAPEGSAAVAAGESPGAHPSERVPHESPGTMTFPLFVLAGLAAVGGALSLPSPRLENLARWLAPS